MDRASRKSTRADAPMRAVPPPYGFFTVPKCVLLGAAWGACARACCLRAARCGRRCASAGRAGRATGAVLHRRGL